MRHKKTANQKFKEAKEKVVDWFCQEDNIDVKARKKAINDLIAAVRDDECERRGIIVLSKKAAKQFYQILNDPKPPTPALIALMKGDFKQVDRLTKKDKNEGK